MSDETCVYETVLEIFRVQTVQYLINSETQLSAIEGDSLDAVEIVCALEAELNISIDEDAFWSGMTVGDCINTVLQLVSGDASTAT